MARTIPIMMNRAGAQRAAQPALDSRKNVVKWSQDFAPNGAGELAREGLTLE